jgi:hypothetical protein
MSLDSDDWISGFRRNSLVDNLDNPEDDNNCQVKKHDEARWYYKTDDKIKVRVHTLDLNEPSGFLDEREFVEAWKEASPSFSLICLPVVESSREPETSCILDDMAKAMIAK